MSRELQAAVFGRDRRARILLGVSVASMLLAVAWTFTARAADEEALPPAYCSYAPPGEYIKDHTIIEHDGWYHLYSISGTAGYCHAYTGNEETISWSVSRDLVHWELRGHVLHASLRNGTFDQHEIWAPYCVRAGDQFFMFYTGVVHPIRPMSYQRIGHDHRFVWDGHRETQGLAVSKDLTEWVKIADAVKGVDVRGRDSHVVRDEANRRWLLYSTGPQTATGCEAYVSESKDLLEWRFIGVCARFPLPDAQQVYSTSESLNVLRHPLTGRWVMLGNFHYVISDDPLDFTSSDPRLYDTRFRGKTIDMGFAGETIQRAGHWYRSGCFGTRDYWRLGFTEIEWVQDGSFRIVRPSIMGSRF
jgi:predicted GH43/DUF377 family glycosyl hydrolase